MIILKTACSDYVGEDGTLNSSRDYAKQFATEQEGREYAKAQRIHTAFTAEPAHAISAYPKLVAALRRYVNDGTTQARNDAEALLRELGESA